MIQQTKQDMTFTPCRQEYKYFKPSQVDLLQFFIPNVVPKYQTPN